MELEELILLTTNDVIGYDLMDNKSRELYKIRDRHLFYHVCNLFDLRAADIAKTTGISSRANIYQALFNGAVKNSLKTYPTMYNQTKEICSRLIHTINNDEWFKCYKERIPKVDKWLNDNCLYD